MAYGNIEEKECVKMRKKKGILFCLAVLVSVGMCPFMITNVSAESFEPERYLVDAKGVPDGMRLVVAAGEYPDSVIDYDSGDIDYDSGEKYIFGKNGLYSGVRATLEELSNAGIDDDSDEALEAIAASFDDFGYLYNDNALIDFHLVNEATGEPVNNVDGNSVEITFDVAYYDLEASFVAEMLEHSTKEWEKGFMHIKDDGNGNVVLREFLPVTAVDGDEWTFETDDFSVFLPVLKAVEEEGSTLPQTSDGVAINMVMTALGIFGLLTMGVWVARKERR